MGNIDFVFERLRGDIFNLLKVKNYGDIDKMVNLIKEKYLIDEIVGFLEEVIFLIEKCEMLMEGSFDEEYFLSWFGYEVRILGLSIFNYMEGYYYDYEIEIDMIIGRIFVVLKIEE